MTQDPDKRRNQGRMAALLSLWVALVAVAASTGGGIWVGIACAIGAIFVGMYFGVRGMREGRRGRSS